MILQTHIIFLFSGSTDSGYRAGLGPQDMRVTDLRKDQQSLPYPDHRSSPYQIPGRDFRDMRGDPRDLRGGPPGGMDLSMRQPEGMDKVAHGYKGDPRDFDQLGGPRQGDPYRGLPDDPQRKVGAMVTPPPAHSHSHRRSPYPVPSRREDVMDRQAVSPNMRGNTSSL